MIMSYYKYHTALKNVHVSTIKFNTCFKKVKTGHTFMMHHYLIHHNLIFVFVLKQINMHLKGHQRKDEVICMKYQTAILMKKQIEMEQMLLRLQNANNLLMSFST